MESPSWRQILGGTAGVALLGTIGYFGQARIHTGATPTTTTHSVKARPTKLSSNPPESNIPATIQSGGDFNMPPVAKKFKVDISGEIVKPGVYEVAEGQRVEDLIKLAGGLKKDADRVNINLALKLKDEQKIIVPAQRLPHTWTNVPPSDLSRVKFNWSPDEQKALGKEPKSNKKQPPANPININSATEVELQSLPGIGPSMAKRIVDYRTAKGDFAQIEDLRKVKGMGEKLLSKIQEWITL